VYTRVSLLCEFLRLLVAFKEELLPAFAVILDQLRVKISIINCTSIVSPLRHVSISDRENLRLTVLLLPHLELIGERSASSGLELLDLFTIEGAVIKNLPLLWGTFIHVHLLIDNAVIANDILYHIL